MRGIAGWSVAVLLLAGVARAASGDGGACVWTGGGGDEVGRYLHQWVAEHQGGTLATWGVGLSDQVAKIELHTDTGAYRIALTLGPRCQEPPAVALQAGGTAGAFPTAADLDALARGFPAERHEEAGGLLPRQPGPGPLHLPFVLVALLCVAVVAVAPAARASGAAAWVLVLALVGLAAWPLLFQPLDTDASVVRAAVAATNVFGDPFHPFLPFLFNRPTTWYSFEPWALRLVPLAFLGIETVLLMLAARRDGGGIAGALAGIWFACEVRRRHGLWDLSDWDVAGTFLMALLLALQRPWARGWLGAILLAALMGAGVASSWLMIVPAGVLAGCVGIEVLRGRWRVLPAIIIGAAFAGLACLALRVFGIGSGLPPEITPTTLWEQMYAELPLARSAVMTLPLALGAGWLLRHLDRVAPRFAALCLALVPAAVAVAHRGSHVAGGYYIGLVTPLLLYAAAVGSVQMAAALIRNWGSAGAAPAAGRAAVAGGLVAITIAAAPGQTAAGVEYLREIAHATRADSLPVHTNRIDLGRLLAYERARAGEGVLTMTTALSGPDDLRARVVIDADGACPTPSDDGHGFYVALFLASDAQRRCLDDLAPRCRDLAPAAARGVNRDWIVLRCAGPADG